MFWGYFAQSLNVGAGLLLLPVAIRFLSPEDLGLWFVFMTLGSLAQLLEFGFQPTIARNVAYILAGATAINKQGLPNFDTQRQPSEKLLAQLIASSRLVYRWVALIAALLMFIAGSAYILTLLSTAQTVDESLLAWFLYASGNVIGFYFSYVNAILQGRGSVTASNKVIVSSRISMLLIGALALALNMGLLGLSFAMLISVVVGRWLAYRFLVKDIYTRAALEHKVGNSPTMLRALRHNANKLGIVQVSTFLVQRAGILIASSFLGLAEAASFSLSVTILMAFSSISMVVVQVSLPHVARAQSQGDGVSLREMYGEMVIIGWVTYAICLLALLMFGAQFLTEIRAKTALLPSWQLFFFGFVYLLELNHSIAASYLTTLNTIPFVKSSVISGLATVTFSLLLVDRYQSLGLIVAQGLVQFAYNNWKWPMMVRRQLDFAWVALVCSAMHHLITTIAKKYRH